MGPPLIVFLCVSLLISCFNCSIFNLSSVQSLLFQHITRQVIESLRQRKSCKFNAIAVSRTLRERYVNVAQSQASPSLRNPEHHSPLVGIDSESVPNAEDFIWQVPWIAQAKQVLRPCDETNRPIVLHWLPLLSHIYL